MKKRLLSMLIALCMALSIFPTAAMAADGTHIITWKWNQGTGSDNNNCGFIFEKIK